MNLLLNLVIDLLAGAVNVAAIRWPEMPMPGTLPESELEQKVGRSQKLVSTVFFIALAIIPLAVMAWILR